MIGLTIGILLVNIKRSERLLLVKCNDNKIVGFNFGQIQLIRFVVVMVWSNSFGHLDSVK